MCKNVLKCAKGPKCVKGPKCAKCAIMTIKVISILFLIILYHDSGEARCINARVVVKNILENTV